MYHTNWRQVQIPTGRGGTFRASPDNNGRLSSDFGVPSTAVGGGMEGGGCQRGNGIRLTTESIRWL